MRKGKGRAGWLTSITGRATTRKKACSWKRAGTDPCELFASPRFTLTRCSILGSQPVLAAWRLARGSWQTGWRPFRTGAFTSSCKHRADSGGGSSATSPFGIVETVSMRSGTTFRGTFGLNVGAGQASIDGSPRSSGNFPCSLQRGHSATLHHRQADQIRSTRESQRTPFAVSAPHGSLPRLSPPPVLFRGRPSSFWRPMPISMNDSGRPRASSPPMEKAVTSVGWPFEMRR